MEISNNAVGQTFANTTANASISAEQATKLENRATEDANISKVNEAAAKPTSLIDVKNTQNVAQANKQVADNTTEDPNELANAVAEVESFLKVQNRNLVFSIDEETERAVVTVKDSQSGDIIRQIPSEEVLQLSEQIQNLQADIGNSVGVFINKQV